MADEPKNPQQIIDNATKALGQSPPSDIQTPTQVTAPPLMQTTPVEPKVEQPLILPEQKKEIVAPPVETPPIAAPPLADSGFPPLPPTPQKPELIVIPPKDQKQEPPQTVVKPPKKKGGKGLLIGLLLFFILTLPVAIYYGTQQITEIRSRAATAYTYSCQTSTACASAGGTVVPKTTSNACSACSTTQVCCKKTYTVPSPTPTIRRGTCSGVCKQGTIGRAIRSCATYGLSPASGNCPYAEDICCSSPPTATPTRTSIIYCLKDCVSSLSKCKPGTQVGGVSYGDCGMGEYCCDIITATSTPTTRPGGTVLPTATPGGGGTCTNRARDGTWHGCDYIRNSGGTGPIASGCKNIIGDPNYDNCGGQPCCQFTFKCGVYCLDQACARSACYDDTPVATATPGPTNTPGPGATSTPEPTSTPTIANTSAPGTCDESCDTDSNCESGLLCYSITGVKRCRKEACPDRSNCECPLAQATATPTTRYYQPGEPTATLTTERVIAEAPVATATQRPTPKVPVSGVIDVKAIVITVASILLLALGLIL